MHNNFEQLPHRFQLDIPNLSQIRIENPKPQLFGVVRGSRVGVKSEAVSFHSTTSNRFENLNDERVSSKYVLYVRFGPIYYVQSRKVGKVGKVGKVRKIENRNSRKQEIEFG